MRNIPNILTAIRLLLIPVFILVFFSDTEKNNLFALYIYITASFTDLLDGYIARKYKFITDLGKVLDPLADKLMLIAVLISLHMKNVIPLFIVLIVCLKELFMITAASILYFGKERIVIPSNIFGKAATVIFTGAIVLLIIFPENIQLLYLVYISVAVKLWALVTYMYTYLRKKNIVK